MPIDWTDKAIKAALRAYAGSVVPDEHGLPRYNIRAALDAAVKAQGLQRADAAERKVEKLREALKDATASLVAATSLLQRGGKKAAPSNKMFDQMVRDYMAASERARAALKETKG